MFQIPLIRNLYKVNTLYSNFLHKFPMFKAVLQPVLDYKKIAKNL